MGTRSLTVIKDDQDKEILTLYRQFDGYPTGHGAELKKFLSKSEITNGFGVRDNKRVFNGLDDLAVRLITFLKNDQARQERRAKGGTPKPRWGEDTIGNLYLCLPGTRGAGEEWLYTITLIDNKINLGVEHLYGSKVCYSGSVEKFSPAEFQKKAYGE